MTSNKKRGYLPGNEFELKKYQVQIQECKLEVESIEDEYLEPALAYLISKLNADKSMFGMILALLGITLTTVNIFKMPAPFNISPSTYWGSLVFMTVAMVFISRKSIALRYMLMEYQIELIRKRISNLK